MNLLSFDAISEGPSLQQLNQQSVGMAPLDSDRKYSDRKYSGEDVGSLHVFSRLHTRSSLLHAGEITVCESSPKRIQINM